MDYWQSGFFEAVGEDMQEDKLYHGVFRQSWQRILELGQSDTKNWIGYGEGKKIHVFNDRDMDAILRAMDAHADDLNKNREAFEAAIDRMTEIDLSEWPAPYTWYDTTIKGINLRPGMLDGSNRPSPVVLKGEETHAVVAGTTGSGKSVFLNSLILNMMVEYPPWELEMYLADFKATEFSRYMNKYGAPHVRACAVTSEIDYAKSLLQHVNDKMKARQKLFQRLGYTNLEDFRASYPTVAVPRVILVVDELQQLFADATAGAQKADILDQIDSLARLGRALGVHMLLASQDVGSALNQQQMTNFNIRFALHCEAAVSNGLLGTGAAEDLRVGQVIAKSSGGMELYTVPIAEDSPEMAIGQDEGYFYRLLLEFVNDAAHFGYRYQDTQKFYQEDQQLDMTRLEEFLEKPQIRNRRNFPPEESRLRYMLLVLGRKVLYSSAAYDIENVFVDYGKNRCLLCLSTNPYDLAYFQKLMAVNLRTAAEGRRDTIDSLDLPFQIPFSLDLNPVVSSLYSEEDRLRDMESLLPKPLAAYDAEELEALKDRYFHYRLAELSILMDEYAIRKQALALLRDSGLNARESCQAMIRDLLEEYETAQEQIDQILERARTGGLGQLRDDDSNILQIIESDLSDMYGMGENIRDFLKLYYRYNILNIRLTHKLFDPQPVWITGIESLERLPSDFSEFISEAMDLNFHVMFFSGAKVPFDVKQASNYIFVSGSDPRLFEEYLDVRHPGADNGVKIYCHVRNTNQRFAFKKYSCQLSASTQGSIDFDELFE